MFRTDLDLIAGVAESCFEGDMYKTVVGARIRNTSRDCLNKLVEQAVDRDTIESMDLNPSIRRLMDIQNGWLWASDTAMSDAPWAAAYAMEKL